MNKTLETLLSLAPKIHQINKDHGFLDAGKLMNKGEMIALTVGELYEAVEGHRKKKWCILSDIQYNFIDGKVMTEDPAAYTNVWDSEFKKLVKDTIQDEIADALIRLLNYIHHWELPVVEREFRKESTLNFGNDILRINYYIIQAFHEDTPGRDWGYVIASILAFCDHWKIPERDILSHIYWKTRYNEGRPYKHNKQY